MARPQLDPILAELESFQRVEPPAFLDALVRERLHDVVERQRVELAAEQRLESVAAASARAAQGKIGSVEAAAYAFGFLAFGQLADGVARLIWRVISG